MSEPHSVGIVVVSHSRLLAEAAVALATQMLHGQHVPLAIAAGLDDGSLGTSAVQIRLALEQVDSPAGVVVLMDLGSAVLSTELALELLSDPSARDRVILSPAPLVEGLVVAAVAAAGGADRDAVAAEAAAALLAKTTHLGSSAAGNPSTEALVTESHAAGAFTVHNQHGLHARPASRLVAVVNSLDASVELRNRTNGVGPVPAGSLSRVATLAALPGHRIEVMATGAQADQAVAQVLALAERHFDEPAASSGAPGTAPAGRGSDHLAPSIPAAPVAKPATAAGPMAASPGIAVGAARLLVDSLVRSGVVEQKSESESESEPGAATSRLRRVVEAVADTRREIEQLRWRTLQDVGAEEAAIFDAHLALLADPALMADVETRLLAGAGAVQAWAATLDDVEQQWARLPDPYLSARAADVHAVAGQVLRALTDGAPRGLPSEGVLVARDLGPAEAAGLDSALVKGVVLALGSPSSHAAILARARGIPMVVCAGEHVLTLPEGTQLILDGGTGELYVDPEPDVVETFQRRARDLAERRTGELAAASRPALTRDGQPVHVLANVGSVADAAAAVLSGAEGAGLVRTEFLFLGRAAAPTVQEQEREYSAVAEAMVGQRITLRTLDVGGDKPLPYISVPSEHNPFLGRRGIRLSLARPELFADQLRAICRAGRHHPVSVMFPMVSAVDELLDARRLLSDAAKPEGLPVGLRVGMMVEVPAAALQIERFLPHLDFVSIGTNDLTQYTLAAERGNPAVAALSDTMNPAVLQLIEQVCLAARGRADVAVCGEAASDEIAVPVLIGLGVRELSVVPRAVPAVKAALRRLDTRICGDLAQQALSLPGPQEVRALVRSTLVDVQP